MGQQKALSHKRNKGKKDKRCKKPFKRYEPNNIV